MQRDIRVRHAIGYGVGDYGMNLFWNSLSLFLLFYYTQVVGIEPRTAGLIFFLGTFWDALTDPAMATIAERTRSRWGGYRPFIPIGGGALAVAFAILLAPVSKDMSGLFMFLLFSHLLFRTCYTAVSVPYSALSSRITNDSRGRTILSGYRMFFAMLGFFTVSSLAFPIVRAMGDGTDISAVGFFWFAVICGIAAFATYLICYYSTSEELTDTAQPQTTFETLIHAKNNLMQNRSLLSMNAIICCQSSANLVFLSMIAFFVQAHATDLNSKESILGLNALIMLFMIPFWTFSAHRFGKRTTWIVAASMVIFGGLHLAFFGNWIFHGWVVQFFVMAAGFGAFGVLVWSMIPDTIEYGEWKMGERSEAAAFGVTLFVQKASIGVAGLCVGFLLQSIGYSEHQHFYPDDVAANVRLIIALGPALLLTLSLIPLYFHPVTRQSHRTAVAAIEEKKARYANYEAKGIGS